MTKIILLIISVILIVKGFIDYNNGKGKKVPEIKQKWIPSPYKAVNIPGFLLIVSGFVLLYLALTAF